MPTGSNNVAADYFLKGGSSISFQWINPSSSGTGDGE